MNNGGEIILVGGQFYYLDGLTLYSDGNYLYYSSGIEEPYIYQHGLEGDSLQFRQLTAGTIVGCSDDGKILYYVQEGILYAWEIGTQERSLIWDIAKQGIEASEISCYFHSFFDGFGQLSRTEGALDRRIIALRADRMPGVYSEALSGNLKKSEGCLFLTH